MVSVSVLSNGSAKYLASYNIKCRKTTDFGQVDGLSRRINNQCSSHEELITASVTVENNVRLVLSNSILHTPVTADDVRQETTNDRVLAH